MLATSLLYLLIHDLVIRQLKFLKGEVDPRTKKFRQILYLRIGIALFDDR